MSVDQHQRSVVITGRTEARTAYARVNAVWLAELTQRGYRVATINGAAVSPDIDADFVIHHHYEEPFSRARSPGKGKWIAVRTWDFGPYPRAWAEKINAQFDQLWVHTEWIREQAIAGGVEAVRIRVVPHGVATAIFRAAGPDFSLQKPARLTLLFVGATVYRKGIDVLIEAYQQAFGHNDDVSLIIKDNSKDVFYRDISYRERIKAMQGQPTAPSITLLDRYLDDADLAALYRTCDVAVFPYRAEGFAIPILEAMACGTPVVAPRFGACLDYVDPERSFLVPPRRIKLPVGRTLAVNSLGFEEAVDEVDFCEVPVKALAEQLREIYTNATSLPAEWASHLEQRAHQRFSWECAIEKVLACLEELSDDQPPVRFR